MNFLKKWSVYRVVTINRDMGKLKSIAEKLKAEINFVKTSSILFYCILFCSFFTNVFHNQKAKRLMKNNRRGFGSSVGSNQRL